MNTNSQIRPAIVDFLRRELIGPDPRPEHLNDNGGDEILRPQDPPRMRYSAGILFPRGIHTVEQDNVSTEATDVADNGPAEGDEPEDITPGGSSNDTDDSTEYEVNRANEFLPSAMGLSALVRMPKSLKVTVQAARYEKKIVTGVGKLYKKNNNESEGEWQPHYYRKAIKGEVFIDCNQFLNDNQCVGTPATFINTGDPNLKLEVHFYSRPYVNAIDPKHDRIITITLINRTLLSGPHPKDSECLFQCEFTVQDTAGGNCFLEYPSKNNLDSENEEESLRLLYRHRKTFAIGHGCAADWPDTEDTAVEMIKTDSMPTYEIKPILPREISNLELSMLQLSNLNDPLSFKICRQLAEEYKKWIDSQDVIINTPDFPFEYRSAAMRHLELCRECHRRIVDGIELLEKSENYRKSFEWMNHAMLAQQLHYNLATSCRRNWITEAGRLVLEKQYSEPDLVNPPKGKGLWRPFQLAFILMNIRAITQKESAERAVVDLIWFPTGGGKTEAYLGLTAFTIFHRRLANSENAGTTILMRYTLRLLTTQQYQRAASLICACELIRRKNCESLGKERISIGLWVGQNVTPNVNSRAVAALNTLLRSGTPNPFTILTCPWCGAQMGPIANGNNYEVKGYRKDGTKVVFRCPDNNCEFHDTRGLPLLVVDEQIYEERPTLIIGTVDKFALLPWYPESRRLFGLTENGSCTVAPPELIIQDELHLISGALGSMVGIYESTIDALCQYEINGIKYPSKIIASTATICRAAEQVQSLYARSLFLFPPQGLRAGDSFFAEEVTKGKDGQSIPGRLYVGVFGSALSSHVTAQIRTLATLLQAVKSVSTSTPNEKDPYWTLMAYFNSLRELGHAATLIRADIREYLNAVWDRLEIRKPLQGANVEDLRRFINFDIELTSRVQSDQITDVLQQLFNSYPGTPENKPVDVCLATNMIQVGLDVSRLGLMAVIGQPKTTSEYIQATSRVGRDIKGPGLVVTIFNPGKPRDRSHFEHFRSYHQSIYRWVEPTSVTPFAVPVRERALHAQLVTLVRFWGSQNERESPNPVPDDALFKHIRKILIKRIEEIDSGECAHSVQMLTDFISRWRTILPPIYGHFGPPPQETPLIYPSGSEPRALWARRSKATPSSMRNVDASCDANVIAQFTNKEAD